MNETITVAAVQLSSGTDKARNLDAAKVLVERAADEGATYIQLPEYFSFLGPPTSLVAAAESLDGPTVSAMSDLARRRKVTLHLGSMVERSSIDGHVFNTGVVIDPEGAVVATYRKSHLFDVDVPGAVVFRESETIIAGDELVTTSLGGTRLGLSICFDVRFAELYRALAVAGAGLLAIPAAFNAATGRAHWEVLVRARAIENHAFVVAAAQCGVTDEGIATYGHSLIVDPWGIVLAESHQDVPEVLVTTLDIDEVSRRRAQIAVMDFRRRDLYESVVSRQDG